MNLLQWLYDAQDVVVVAHYAHYWTVPDTETANLERFTELCKGNSVWCSWYGVIGCYC